MAFVYRNTKPIQNSRPKTPAPNAYKHQSKYQTNNNTVTFMDRSKRQIWQTNPNPGPGQYITEEQLSMKQDRVVYRGNADDFLILEEDVENKIKGCGSSFKSKSKRLENKWQDTPGPGSYQVSSDKLKNKKKSNLMKKSNQLTRYILEQTKKQAGQLQLNQTQQKEPDNFKNHDWGNESKVQISYPQKKGQTNGMSIFSSKVSRTALVRPMTSIGPGSYNLDKFDQKGIDKKARVNRYKISISVSQRKCETPAAVGPGSYNPDNLIFCEKRISQSRGIQCFGSLQSRFGNNSKKKIIKKITEVGKDHVSKQQDKSEQFRKKVPFMSETSKDYNNFLSSTTKSILNTNTSPGYYQIQNNMYDKLLKKNYNKADNVIFGTATKTQLNKKNDYKNPNCSKQLNLGGNKKLNKPASACQGKQKRITNDWSKKPNNNQNNAYIQKNILDYRPLCYDNENKTFTKQYRQKQQIQAPFMTVSERFKYKTLDYSEKIMRQIEEQEQMNTVNMALGCKKQKGVVKPNNMIKSFLSRARQQQASIKNNKQKKYERVLGPKKQNYTSIGPQSYNPVHLKSKRSHNVLFQSSKSIQN